MKIKSILKPLFALALIGASLPVSSEILRITGQIEALWMQPRGIDLESNWIVGNLRNVNGNSTFFWFEGKSDTVPMTLIQSYHLNKPAALQIDTSRGGFIYSLYSE